MALKFRVKSKDEIPVALADHYVERDGAWILDADGAADKSKLEEVRSMNAALLKERDELKQRFEGIDPEEVRTLTAEKRRLEEAQQMKAGEIEKVMENRLKNARAEWDRQFAAVASERDALSSRLTCIQIDQAVVTEATKRGLRATALPDITSRARSTFRLVNGIPQAFEADGKTVRYGKDGVTPMTLAEWIDMQVSDAPHLFEANAGGGAGGNGSSGGGNRSAGNPFRRESWNLTEQMKMEKADPQLAARMKIS